MLNIRNLAGAPTKTLSSHVLVLLADTVFARVSLAEKPSAKQQPSFTYTSESINDMISYTLCTGNSDFHSSVVPRSDMKA